MAANAADVREAAPPGGPPFSLESLLQALREFAIAVDRDGFIRTIWSPTLLHSHDPKALLLGRPLSEVLDQQTYDRFTELSRRPDDVGRSRTIECTVGFADGVRCFAVRALPVANGTGEPEALWLLAFDISHRKRAVEELQKSETLLVQAEELANIGSFEVNLETTEVVWSPQLCRALQLHPATRPLTREFLWQFVHPDDLDRVRRDDEMLRTRAQPFEHEARWIRSDGVIRTMYTRGVPVADASGRVVRMVGISLDITERAQVEEELRRLSQELIRANDESRRHTARELHESAGQSLAALKMTLGRLKESLPEEDGLAYELLQSSMELADGAIREVRTVSYLMHPPLLDEAGLSPALRWYAKGFSERSGIKVEIEIPDDIGRASQEIETTVFRIVQEALTNVHRYSGSRTAKICLMREGGQIRAEVRDEGCGIAMPSHAGGAPPPTGVGIAGMRERVKQMNGVFEVESAPGRGTTVRAILPVAPNELLHRTIHARHDSNAEKRQRRKGPNAHC